MNVTETRKAYYGLFSRIFLSEMDEESLKAMEESEDFEVLFPKYAKWDKRKENKKELIERYLNVDFADVTLLHLIPYESFYVREDAMIESGGANPVVSFYNDFGFRADLDRARVVSPDHIGVELEFMHLLCSKELEALKDENEEAANFIRNLQKDFLREHILKWAFMYLMNVYEEARYPFYKDASKALLEFLLEDFEYLSKR